MKTVSTFIAGLLMLCTAVAQNPPLQTPAAQPTKRTDIYHVLFAKAGVGKAAQLGDALRNQLPNAPMPGHYLVLRHQQGDEWDYVAIEHLGTSATVNAAAPPVPPAVRDLYDWHTDSFVSGPSWAEFSRALGMAPESVAKTVDSVYVVAVMRAAPGQRDALDKFITAPPTPGGAPAGETVVLQHLEGGPWQFLTVTRFNSWQEYATNQTSSVADTRKNPAGGWSQLRSLSSFHRDTITDRISPAAAQTAPTK
ncbi:MAG TPA: hypothetical protein VD837_00155 [Terriglobales bacterium]|nr:hypothetical protein [Terriglobales bacterium]